MYKSKIISLFCLSILLLTSIVYIPNAKAEAPSIEWLIMLRCAGDNSLSIAVDDDLEEMMRVGSTDKVKIIVLADKAELGDTKLYEVQEGSLKDLGWFGSNVIPATPEINTGSPESLIELVRYCNKTYPAKRHFIIEWNHGFGGWISTMADTTNGNDVMTGEEYDYALKEITSILGKRVDIIGWDACYQAMLSLMYICKDYADYFLGSEESEPWDGWEYSYFLNKLKSNPTASPKELASWAVESYYQEYSATGKSFTLSAVNLIDLDIKLMNSFNLFWQELMFYSYNYSSEISEARNNTLTYYDQYGYSFFDLYSVVDNIEKRLERKVTANATALKSYINACVLNKTASSDLTASGGIAIYYPRSFACMLADFKKLSICRETNYYSFLTMYFKAEQIPPQFTPSPVLNSTGGKVMINGTNVEFKVNRGKWLTGYKTLETGTYTIYVRAYNNGFYSEEINGVFSAVNKVETEIGKKKLVIELKKGWNMFPYIAPIAEVKTAKDLANLLGAKSVIRRVEEKGEYESYIYGQLQNNFNLELGKTYFVNVEEDKTYEYDAVVQQKLQINLHKGWNLVTYPKWADTMAKDLVKELGVKAIAIKDKTTGKLLTNFGQEINNFNVSYAMPLYIYTETEKILSFGGSQE